MTTTFDITIKAIVDDETGKIRFQAMAEKSEKTGQHLIWSESPYLEDAFRDLGREIKRIVYKEGSADLQDKKQ
jgi:hypothetical protein